MEYFVVPVIAVFTKYEQFKFNIRMRLEDEDRLGSEAPGEAERVFQEQYLSRLGGKVDPHFVRLESECTKAVLRSYTEFFPQGCTNQATTALNCLKRQQKP